jgi:hypothetical protein
MQVIMETLTKNAHGYVDKRNDDHTADNEILDISKQIIDISNVLTSVNIGSGSLTGPIGMFIHIYGCAFTYMGDCVCNYIFLDFH